MNSLKKNTINIVIPTMWKEQNLVQYLTKKTSKIKGEISKTIKKFDKASDVQRRINLDSLNVYKYNHFLNGKNWDFPKYEYAKNLSNRLSNK